MPPASLKQHLPDWVPSPDFFLLALHRETMQAELNRLLTPGYISLDNFQEVAWQTLRAWQAHHHPNEGATNDFNALFPNAFDIWDGMKIYNLTTNQVGTIKKAGRNRYGMWGAKVSFDISRHHRLMFDDDDLIRFVPANSRSDVDSVGYERETQLNKNTGNFKGVISWSCTKQEPASSGKPFSGERQTFVPKLVSTLTDIPGYSMQTWDQKFDNMLQVDVYHTNESVASALRTWFRRYVDEYRWYFELLGADQFYFVQTGNEEPVRRWRNDLAHRAMFFYLRTKEMRSTLIRNISDIEIAVSLSRDTADENTCPEPTGVSEVTINDMGLDA